MRPNMVGTSWETEGVGNSRIGEFELWRQIPRGILIAENWGGGVVEPSFSLNWLLITNTHLYVPKFGPDGDVLARFGCNMNEKMILVGKINF